ncbi:RagB/SusD family nutrient uptake outer membrane protein [Terrimonas rubra]|uniref:RagB/SusD family nutrient uptake outer membrane protein n=1 Tax=Terrimonas rubra TaxID=1035890 RepID=A0ABW6A6Z3_9BACT
MSLRKYIFLFLFTPVLFACKKQLDLVPPDQVPESAVFKSVPDVEKALIGVYAQLNGAFDNEIYASVLYSDEANLHIENNTGRGVNTYRWQVDATSGDVTAAWAAYYFTIDRANRVIAGAEKLTGINPVQEALRKQLIGEATAIRAYCHLQLLINFAENFDPGSLAVPYMKTAVISKPARETVQNVFANIRTDLTNAEALIPASFTNNNRVTLSAVYAIRARTALYAKDWDGAISAATAAINAVPLATRTAYPLIWTDASESEVIFKTKRVTGQTRFGDNFYDRSQAKIMYAVAYEMLALFDATNDIRYASTVLVRSGANRFSIGKYVGGDAAEPNRADIKNFRTAEMYLIRAEAYAEKTGQLNLGTADLNFLRRARINGYVDATFTTKETLIDAILLERYKELSFEGQRIHDLHRHKLPVTRIPQDAENALGAVTLLPTAKEYYFPIPNSEMQANENMIQNPTYR